MFRPDDEDRSSLHSRLSTRLTPVFLGLTRLGALLLLAAGAPARAQITAPIVGAPNSLGTVVNPLDAGGIRTIEGGTKPASSNNVFHRFTDFNTSNDPGLNRVTFLNDRSNVFVGVLSPTVITVPVGLQTKGSLFWLSPSGISITGGGTFENVSNLTLSTATGLQFIGGQAFDAVSTTAAQALVLSGEPITGSAGLETNTSSLSGVGLTNNGDLSYSGGLLTVDQSLLLDARGGTNVGGSVEGGSVLLSGGEIQAPAAGVGEPSPRTGGSVELVGAGVRLTTLETKASSINVSETTGSISISAASQGVVLDGASLQSGGGSISISGKGGGASSTGVELFNAKLSTTSGAIDVNGTGGGAGGGDASGLRLLSGSQLTTLGGSISLSGKGGTDVDPGEGGDGVASAFGIDIAGSLISSQGGAILLNGEGGTASGSGFAVAAGVLISETSTLYSNDGDISISGKGGSTGGGGGGGNSSAGVQLEASSSLLSGLGAITLDGEGGSSEDGGAKGLRLLDSILSSTAGDQTLQGKGGTAGSTGFDASGIEIENTTISTDSGTISADGTGGNAPTGYSIGTSILNNSFVTSNTGNINLSGTGGSAGSESDAHGVEIISSSTVTTSSGDISVSGSGGSADSGSAAGIAITTSTLGSFGDVDGKGNIQLSGTGGSGIRSNGLQIDASSIISNGGSLNLSGTATSGSFEATGITMAGATLSTGLLATGLEGGSITLSGTGGNAEKAVGVSTTFQEQPDVTPPAKSTLISTVGSQAVISITGVGGTQGSATEGGSVQGVRLAGGTILSANQADINLIGTGGKAYAGQADGIVLQAAASDQQFTVPSDPLNVSVFSGGTTTLKGVGGTALIDEESGFTGAGVRATGITLETLSDVFSEEPPPNVLVAISSEAIRLDGKGGSGGLDLSGISLTGNPGLGASVFISASGGALQMDGLGGSGSGTARGINIDGAQVDTTSGSLKATGTGGSTSSGSASGLAIVNNSSLFSDSGSLELTGQAGSGTELAAGLLIEDSNLFSGATTAGQGNISLSGTGGSGSDSYGLFLSTAFITSYAGAQTYFGTAADSGGESSGILLNNAFLNSGKGSFEEGGPVDGGAISLTGSGKTGADALGITSVASQINNLGTGSITITGTGGTQQLPAGDSSGGSVRGIQLIATDVRTDDGNISLNGTGGQAYAGQADGIALLGSGASTSLDNFDGTISLIGKGGSPLTSEAFNGAQVEARGIALEGPEPVFIDSFGSVSLDGTGGSGGRQLSGVSLSGVSTSVDTDGALTISGKGGTAIATDGSSTLGFAGVELLDGASLFSDGGPITLTGTGVNWTPSLPTATAPSGLRSIGVSVDNFSNISSNFGAINIDGTGGSISPTLSAAASVGVAITRDAAIETEGTIQVQGASGINNAAAPFTAGVALLWGGQINGFGEGSIEISTGSGHAGTYGVLLADIDLFGPAPSHEFTTAIQAFGDGGISISGNTSASAADASGFEPAGVAIRTESPDGEGGTISRAVELFTIGGSIDIHGSAGGSGKAVLSEAAARISTDDSNAGITISSGAGLVQLSGELDSAGPIDFPSVAALNLQDTLFSGTGLVTLPTSGTTTVLGNVSAQSVAIAGGTLTGPGTLTLNADSSWSGGTITGDGSLDVASGATFTLNGGVKFLGDRTFNNDGVIA
ncbi:MAG: hypothetical protein VKI83_03275, partial [Synechococcaceae cyanobacterium]|nr:hypothetical protein [Synechococcaceae cyanobacterium]